MIATNVFLHLRICYCMKNVKLWGALCAFVLVVLALPLLLFGCGKEKIAKNVYSIKADYDADKHALVCNQTVEYANTCNEVLNKVCFFVYGNAFAEGQNTVSKAYETKAYPNGKSYGNVSFESVCVGDKQAEFALQEADASILTVQLAENLFPDERVTIELAYTVNLANIRHRLGYGNNTINFGNFFPIACVWEDGDFVKNKFAPNGDPFYSEVSDFCVEISYPQNLTLACTGLAETSQNNGQNISVCKAQDVRDFCFVLSDKFEIKTKTTEQTQVNYYFYEDEDADAHLETAVKAMETFNQLFGKYPYKVVNVVKADFCFGGMEYPNLVLIADDVKGADVDYVIVHELAHQWWYGMVGNNEFSEPWVDEGLTEYSCALFYEKHPEYGLKYNQIMQNALETYQKFAKVYTDINGSVDESMSRNLCQYATEPEYVNCTYTKGMLLFDAVRCSMSDRKFFCALQNYFKTYQYKNSSTQKLIESFSKSCHINLNGLFKAWIDGSVKLGV